MKKTYRVFDEDNAHLYDITQVKKGDKTVYTLSFADNNEWDNHLKGATFIRMYDDGNGVKISKISKLIDYHEFSALHILTSFIVNHADTGMMPKHRIEEVKVVLTV